MQGYIYCEGFLLHCCLKSSHNSVPLNVHLIHFSSAWMVWSKTPRGSTRGHRPIQEEPPWIPSLRPHFLKGLLYNIFSSGIKDEGSVSLLIYWTENDLSAYLWCHFILIKMGVSHNLQGRGRKFSLQLSSSTLAGYPYTGHKWTASPPRAPSHTLLYGQIFGWIHPWNICNATQ